MANKTLVLAAVAGFSMSVSAAAADISAPFFGASPYIKGELGWMSPDGSGGFWNAPDPTTPTVSFNVDGSDEAFGSLAFGLDWGNGLRGELGLFATGTSDVTGPCSGASDGSLCSTHADITQASVSTRGAMASIYYSPLEAQGNSGAFQPFFVVGLGAAENDMGNWTRVNPSATRPTRTFSGDKNVDFAWSIGAGFSYAVNNPGQFPIILETSLRYFDYGKAEGGSTVLSDNGNGPRTPFTFDNKATVLSFALRIPLRRN
ncbi:outer membrane protein [Phycobacter sp. K97]|jgi:opacity protein-like surface antigen|uniref:outer membrane protein n=1 Tax=Phycobacter sedimenti TaxID=3133977 RepID=UPI00311F6FFD